MSTKKKKLLKKKYRPPKKEEPKRPYPTTNAKMISELMESNKIKGKYKDYVIIAGSRLIDWLGSYEISTKDMKSVGVKETVIVHKSKLKNVFGEELGSQFWKAGMRTNMGVESRRMKCARSQR